MKGRYSVMKCVSCALVTGDWCHRQQEAMAALEAEKPIKVDSPQLCSR